ncbi:MAG: hypothetical protein MRY76_07370 [Pseudomonadales bacterium]|nr:hypothetical protein [Pseudomonadales bacterium]
MMEQVRALLLKNRYSVLVTTITAYVLVVVIEGAVTGREARVIDLDNPYFELNIQDFEEFRDRRERE